MVELNKRQLTRYNFVCQVKESIDISNVFWYLADWVRWISSNNYTYDLFYMFPGEMVQAYTRD